MKKIPIEVTISTATACVSRKRQGVMYPRVALDQRDTIVAWEEMAPPPQVRLVFRDLGDRNEKRSEPAGR